MSLTADRRSLLLLALMFSLLLHAVAVAVAPRGAAARLPELPLQIELFTVAAPVPRPVEPRPAPPSVVKPMRSLKRTAPAQPAAPPPTVEDHRGEAPAPVSPLPFVFKAKFAPPAEPQEGSDAPRTSGEGTAAVATTAPELLQEIKPAYPDEARRADVDGDVMLRVTIRADGSVEAVQVESTPGYGLEHAARAAMLRARFKPATRGGVPVRTTILYRYSFRLD